MRLLAALDRVERRGDAAQREGVAGGVAAAGGGLHLHVGASAHGGDELRLLGGVLHPRRLAAREHRERAVADRDPDLGIGLEVVGGDELRLVGDVLARLLADEEVDVAVIERRRLLVGRDRQHVADLAVVRRIGVGAPGVVLADLGGSLGKRRRGGRKQREAGDGRNGSAHRLSVIPVRGRIRMRAGCLQNPFASF